MLSRILLFFSSFVLCFIFAEFISYRNVKSKLENAEVDEDVFEFYNLHYKTLHHLADKPLSKWKDNLLELLFREVGSGDSIILIQGDSWGTQFEIKKSKEILLNISDSNNIRFILAGNTSYSPSVSTAQLTKLKQDFKISPDYIIISIDQSDIGDELCRYKDLRKKIDGKIIVEPEPVGGAQVFGVKNHIDKYRILYSKGFYIFRLIKYKIFANKLAKLYKNYEVKCGGENVLFKPLIEGLSDHDRNYIIEVIQDYINIAFSNKKLKKLFFVVHPHKKHLEGIYKENVESVINEAVKKSVYSKSIIILDPYDTVKNKNIPLNQIFVKEDAFSHLQDDYFVKYYLNNVITTLVKFI